MLQVKLFSTSLQNDAFVDFLEKNPHWKGEEDDEVLEAYMNDWLSKHPDIEVVDSPHPIWAENHLFFFLVYKK